MEKPLEEKSPAITRDRPTVDVSVIIVNYNVREFLEQALSSVYRAADGMEIEVFVVDNNSVDGSVEAVRSTFPDVRLISNNANVGFGAANNQAILESSGRYLLILNPDTIVQEDTLSTLMDFMDQHPRAGAAGCRILNPDGSFAPESRRAFPTPRVAFFRIVGLSRLFPGSKTFGRYNLSYLPVDEVAEVDALSGSCMMLRRSALIRTFAEEKLLSERPSEARREQPVFLFDEKFFMYGEDLDLCYRIQEGGWKIFYVPQTQIIHYKGESTRKGDLRYVRLFYGAMLLFAEKHFSQRSRFFRLALRMGILGRAAASALVRALKRLALPALDFFLVYASVVGVGLFRLGWPASELGVRFLLSTPLVYGVATAVGIRLSGGYERGRQRLRPAMAGLFGGFLIVATLSFFLKTIAFSRFVIAVGLIPSAIAIVSVRLLINRRQRGTKRAVVVGHGLEAARLDRMVSSQINAPFVVVGFLETETETQRPTPGIRVPRLGTISQIRDVIRLHNIDEVIFATDGLSNRTILSVMSGLRDLPIEFKTFVEGGSHVIGKATVADLSIPLVAAEVAHGRPASDFTRELFHRALAIAGLLLYPLVALLSSISRGARLQGAAARLRQLRHVVAGRVALIGLSSDEGFEPPSEWELGPGVFSVSDSLPTADPGPEDRRRAWAFYLNNRSLTLDLQIIRSSLAGRPPGYPE